MKITSPIISAGSGSIAGVTASRNKGGLYLRARAVPTNPNSTFQQAVRGILSDLVNHWTTTLTAAQRTAWETYAANTPVYDTLGAQINLSGQQMYVRSNTARIQAGAARVDAGPTIYDLGSFTNPSISAISEGASSLSLVFTATDDWANENNAEMLVYVSRQQNPSINYFKGPYRYADSIQGNATTPPTSPATIALPFAVTQGNRLFVKVNVSRADGRYSQAFRLTGLAGA